MSYTGPENELLPGEHKIKCSNCEFTYYEEKFTDDEDNFDPVCNECYEEQDNLSRCCGAAIILTDLCSECKEHI